jgi:hypothetical protein
MAIYPYCHIDNVVRCALLPAANTHTIRCGRFASRTPICRRLACASGRCGSHRAMQPLAYDGHVFGPLFFFFFTMDAPMPTSTDVARWLGAHVLSCWPVCTSIIAFLTVANCALMTLTNVIGKLIATVQVQRQARREKKAEQERGARA